MQPAPPSHTPAAAMPIGHSGAGMPAVPTPVVPPAPPYGPPAEQWLPTTHTTPRVDPGTPMPADPRLQPHGLAPHPEVAHLRQVEALQAQLASVQAALAQATARLSATAQASPGVHPDAGAGFGSPHALGPQAAPFGPATPTAMAGAVTPTTVPPAQAAPNPMATPAPTTDRQPP